MKIKIKNWKHELIPIESSKNESDRIVDLLLYKNLHALIKTLHVFLGIHNKNFICRRCLTSYTNKNLLMIHKPKCEQQKITTTRKSNESHLHWKKHFHRKPLYFENIAGFEADNQINRF